MTNRDAFEKWYKKFYNNFSIHYLEDFDEKFQMYSNARLDLAWKAWCAALDAAKTVDILDYNSAY
jgi:hypothetical protein